MSPSGLVDMLLVEDSPADVELTLRSLRKVSATHRIQVTRDGEEALEFIFGTSTHKGHTPRVILLDLKLPKVDGLEVLRRLRGDERTREIPVVILTSSKEQCDMVESYQLGVNSYIVKPVSFTRFAEVVGQLGLYWLLLNETPQH